MSQPYKFSDLPFGAVFNLDSDFKDSKRVAIRKIQKIISSPKFEDGPAYNAVEQRSGGKELLISNDAIVYLSE